MFGIRRDTWSDTELAPLTVPPPEEVEPTGLPDPIVWASNYEMRYVEGAIPGDGATPAPSSATTLWVRDRRGRDLDFAALTAMSDIFYPRVFLRRGAPSPAGTISLTTYFHADAARPVRPWAPTSSWAALAPTDSRAASSTSRLRSGAGAGSCWSTTHQLVYFKD